MLKKIRTIAAGAVFILCTLLFLDFTGLAAKWFGWLAKIQFLPAVLAVNAGVVLALVLLTLVFGRLYCSIICPLGIFQDIAARSFKGWRKTHKKSYSWSPEKKWLRYGVLVIFIILLIAGRGYGTHCSIQLVRPHCPESFCARMALGQQPLRMDCREGRGICIRA